MRGEGWGIHLTTVQAVGFACMAKEYWDWLVLSPKINNVIRVKYSSTANKRKRGSLGPGNPVADYNYRYQSLRPISRCIF